MFIDRAFSVDAENSRVLHREYTQEEWDTFGETEYAQVNNVVLDYEGIVIRAALGELNSLVEYELKWVAKSIYQKRYGKNPSSRSKLARKKINEIHKIIEDEFQVKLKDLPGFAEIHNMRKIINAYKHDDGYSGQYEPFLTIAIEKKYELDIQMVREYLEAVREFLSALPGERLNWGQDVRIKPIRS